MDFIRDNMKAVVIGAIVVILIAVVASVAVAYTAGEDGALAVRSTIPYIAAGALGLGILGLIVMWWRGRYTYDEYDYEYEDD